MYPFTLNQSSLCNWASAVDAFFDCATELFSGFERIIQLNIQTAKTSNSERQALAQAALHARSPDELIDLHSQRLPTTVSKTFSYWQHLEEIAVETGSRLFAAMCAHSGEFLERVEKMTGIASGKVAAQFDKTGLLFTEKPAATKPAAIVDSQGKALSLGVTPRDVH